MDTLIEIGMAIELVKMSLLSGCVLWGAWQTRKRWVTWHNRQQCAAMEKRQRHQEQLSFINDIEQAKYERLINRR